jgi:glycosyltransferase involved in cell wall biosynthesis
MQVNVSIIMATYNRYDTFVEAVQSILNQTYSHFELIIVDDGSTDERYKQLENMFKENQRIQILRLEENSVKKFGHKNRGYVRHQGILKARGRLIAICDDDDLWKPQKLEVQMKRMQETGIDFCSSEGYYCIGDFRTNPGPWNMRIYHHEHYRWFLIQKLGGEGKLPEIWEKGFLEIHNFIVHSSVIFSKKIYMDVGGYRDLPVDEDYDLLRRINANEKHLFIHEPLFLYQGQ